MAPQDTQAWLVAPDFPGATEGVALCATHADRITVPFGWTLTDDRPPARPKRRRKKKSVAEPQDATAAPPPTAQTPQAKPAKAAPKPKAQTARAKPETTTVPGRPQEPAASEPPPLEPVAIAQPETDAGGDSAAEQASDVGEPTQDQARVGDGRDDPQADTVDITDDATMQLPAIKLDHPSSPAEVPLNADATAAAVGESERRLSVVPGEDDPNKTFGFDDEGQGALWAEREAEREPSESTPLLKRAFRVVKDE